MFPSHIHFCVIIHSVSFPLLSFPSFFHRHLILFSFIFPVCIRYQMVFLYVFSSSFFRTLLMTHFLYFLLYEIRTKASYGHILYMILWTIIYQNMGKWWMISANHTDEWNRLVVSGWEWKIIFSSKYFFSSSKHILEQFCIFNSIKFGSCVVLMCTVHYQLFGGNESRFTRKPLKTICGFRGRKRKLKEICGEVSARMRKYECKFTICAPCNLIKGGILTKAWFLWKVD